MRIKNIALLITSIILFSGCRDYNSDRYQNTEYQAINDLILEMTNYKYMSNAHDFGDREITLYIVPTLDTIVAQMHQPIGWVISSNEVSFNKENKERYLTELKDHKEEQTNFETLTKGEIIPREIEYNFEVSNLNVVIKKDNDLICHNLDENEIGILSVSRIVFNRKMNKGYLHYQFWCGQGCYWNNNIEIKKINGKWEISKRYSGSIA